MVSLRDRLRKNYGKDGIYAGSSHFRDYWSRDALFACFGALALKDYAIVRKTLDLFLNNLDDTGHVPLRIGGKNEVLRYLGLPTKQGAWHNQDKGNNPSYDGNALLLIVAQKYEDLSGEKIDRKQLRLVQAWNDTHEKKHLLHEGPYSSWEDSVKHSGARLYTNVCYYRSLLAATSLFNNVTYQRRAENTRKALQRWFNGTYFTDGKHKHCMVAGNLLAVVWGVADREQANSVLQAIASRQTIVPPAGFWKPTMRDAYIPFFFIHLQDYHGMMEWSWLAAVEIAAYRVIGNTREANRREKILDTLIRTYKGFHEVYENDKPVSRLVYRSEKHFSWAMGLLLASQHVDVLR